MELSVDQIKRIVEASLLMNREPQTAKKIAELFTPEENITERAVVDTLTLLAEDYRGRGVELIEVATGYRFQVCADLSPWIQRTMAEKPQRYSRALLETLALIAYRQPITRAEIEEIRGVVVSTQIMRTLEEREWVRVIGHRDVPGRPALYATTKQFLNDLNLKSLGELPTLAELQDLDKVDGEFQQMNLPISDAPPENAEAQSIEAQSTDLNENNELGPVLNATEEVQQAEETNKLSDQAMTENSLLSTEPEEDRDVGIIDDELLDEMDEEGQSENTFSLIIDDSEEHNNEATLMGAGESVIDLDSHGEMNGEESEDKPIDVVGEVEAILTITEDQEESEWISGDSLNEMDSDTFGLEVGNETDAEPVRKRHSDEIDLDEDAESLLALEEIE